MQIDLLDANWNQLKILNEHITSGQLARNVGDIGQGSLELMNVDTELYEMLQAPSLLRAKDVRDEKAFQTIWPIYSVSKSFDEASIQISDAKSLLEKTLNAYKADEPRGSSPNGRIQNQPANLALNTLIENNLGVGAGLRNLNVQTESPSDVTSFISLETSYQFLNNIFGQIVRSAKTNGERLYYDFIPNFSNNTLVFRTYTGQRGRNRLSYSLRSSDNSVHDYTINVDKEVTTVGYGLGSQRGKGQVVIKAERNQKDSLFFRIEGTQPASANTTSEVSVIADSLISNSGVTVAAEVGSNDLFQWGDLINFVDDGFVYPCEVYAIQVDLRQVNSELDDTITYLLRGLE